MAIKWGFGKKGEKDPKDQTPVPEARDANGEAEGKSQGEAPPAIERKGILLLGRGATASLWEKQLAGAGIEFVDSHKLAAADFAKFEFETIIETDGLGSGGGFWREEDSASEGFPALAPGGVLALPCYGSSPTVMAASAGKLGASVIGYALYEAPAGQEAGARMIEAARPMQASDEAWDEGVKRLESMGFKVEKVGDAPGLVFGRTLACLINETAHALTEGIASPEDIDVAMQLGVNYPKGLCAWADSIGLDLILEILGGLADHYDEDRYRPAPLLRHMHLAGRRFLREAPAADKAQAE